MGPQSLLFLAKSVGSYGAKGVLTDGVSPEFPDQSPITVAGPRPILTAFPQTIPRLRSVKTKCMPASSECQFTGELAENSSRAKLNGYRRPL
jgi:hypothetical protein